MTASQWITVVQGIFVPLFLAAGGALLRALRAESKAREESVSALNKRVQEVDKKVDEEASKTKQWAEERFINVQGLELLFLKHTSEIKELMGKDQTASRDLYEVILKLNSLTERRITFLEASTGVQAPPIPPA